MQTTDDLRRAWSYNGALDAGLDLQAYDWAQVPEGTWTSRLDFKVWSSQSGAEHLVCCMTSLEDGGRSRLSAFRPKQTARRRYTPKDGAIDFSEPGLDGGVFRVTVGRNSKGSLTWLAAEVAK